MVEVTLQRTGRGQLRAFSDEDADALGEYPEYKPLRAKITGARKERSLQQLKLYWACCRTVADNTMDNNWATPEKVDFQCKVKCRLIKEFVVVNNTTHIIPGSVSYAEMNHLEACNYFQRAFEEMANFLGISKDELLQNAES